MALCSARTLTHERGDSVTSLERFERWQRVLRAALEKMEACQHSALDEAFWSQLRAAMLSAGATETEIDALAAHQVCCVVEWTAHDSEERQYQFELIAEHLSCTDMFVRIGKGDSFVKVDFPARPKVH